jgi:hypothetical protein
MLALGISGYIIINSCILFNQDSMKKKSQEKHIELELGDDTEESEDSEGNDSSEGDQGKGGGKK